MRAILRFLAVLALPALFTLVSSAPPLPRTPQQNVSPGLSVLELSLALDGQGRPVLGWVEAVNPNTQRLSVQRLEGGGRSVLQDAPLERGRWVRLGGVLNVDPNSAAQGVFVRPTPDGRIWAAWSENGGHADIVQFARWDGSRWAWQQTMRQSIDLTYAARSRDLAPLPDGTPLWAWAEITQTGVKVQTRRWDGSSWLESAPLSLDALKIASQPALAINARGERAVVWLEGDAARSDVFVKRWDGVRWAQLGGALNVRPNTFTFAPAVALSSQGLPIVAWLEDRAGVDTLFVKRWDGVRWVRLGDALNADSRAFANKPSLTVRQGEPCVAWAEGTDARQSAFLKCFSSGRWSGVQVSSGSADARGPQLASSRDGLALAWRERVGTGPYRIGYRQWRGPLE